MKTGIHIALLSDTHGYHEDIIMPPADIVLHAGDATLMGEEAEWREFCRWFSLLEVPDKVFIPGNHDFGYFSFDTDVWCPQCSVVTVRDLSIYGVSYVPNLPGWAYHASEEQLYDMLTDGLGADIWLTHGPPKGVLGGSYGSEGFRAVFDDCPSGRPKLWVFGHVHEAAGITHIDGTTFVNCSVLDRQYQLVRQPIIFEMPNII